VDRLLADEAFAPLFDHHGRIPIRDALRTVLAGLRSSRLHDNADPVPDAAHLAVQVAERLEAQARPSLRPVHNLTGTVLHTNLGRACLPVEAADALRSVAVSACALEYDLSAGGRGERDHHIEPLIAGLTGAQAALVVNNNAAAVLLLLNTLASRKRVVISRGELVEIGGQFRIPDIMKRAGARLVEVGTTNRTHARDYQEALDTPAGLVMKVHASNYRIEGFVHEVPEREVAAIAKAAGVPSATDLGSGSLVDLRRYGLPYEPTVREMIDSGIDLVSFSGDKLLGGPQCGIIAGRRDLIERMQRNPLRRALRADKMTLAALEQVLRIYRFHADELAQRLPTLRLLTLPQETIRASALRLLPAVQAAIERVWPACYRVSAADCLGQVGSGALPVDTLPSHGLRIETTAPKRERREALVVLEGALRSLPRPVIARLERDALVLDLRCLDDEGGFVSQLAALAPPG
jgi:L-seryl-tRNA(Ser) seleniumtransferase